MAVRAGEGVIDVGGRLEPRFPDISSVLAANALDEINDLSGVAPDFRLDEIRLLLEIDPAAGPADVTGRTCLHVVEAVRQALGIRVEAMPVPARSLPRYELKARRVVRREGEPAPSG